ncbi:MAG TPA: acetamidase/formamidase family protein [Thermomicrobiales bacterium]|nr:acetamidase/formamidase family protein [Thermomicrobiales bacterium]
MGWSRWRHEEARVVPAERHTFSLRPDAPPVLRVRPGEIVRFETSPAPAELLFAAGDDWLRQLDTRRINAVTGPVYIEGVQPGDAVAIEILDIETAGWGWNASIPNFGLLAANVPEPLLRRIPLVEGRAWINEALSVPIEPMIGCLGLAPAQGETSTLAPPFPWAGNYDLTQVCPGSTILFPAQVPGGLVSIGDLHAAMGEGEATSVAIECAGSATVRLDVRKGLELMMPRIETPERLYTIGLAERGDYTAARRHACDQMFSYLTEERRLTVEDAYILFSAAVDLSFGGPAGAVALASVPLDVLAARER